MSEMSERKVLEEEEEEAEEAEEEEEEEAGGTSKVRTPHKDVGNKETEYVLVNCGLLTHPSASRETRRRHRRPCFPPARLRACQNKGPVRVHISVSYIVYASTAKRF